MTSWKASRLVFWIASPSTGCRHSGIEGRTGPRVMLRIFTHDVGSIHLPPPNVRTRRTLGLGHEEPDLISERERFKDAFSDRNETTLSIVPQRH
ncbi:hypothetical protein B0O80DRAFT_462135 [Mortierella sp. GBAus27b]|nr:hypothetical protein B0O80DRAFT_462135 [Mortierella sp. GBAus27b]